MVIELAGWALIPVALTALFLFLEKKTSFKNWNYWVKQLIYGLAFGLYAILATQFGIPASYNADGTPSALVNVRDAGPLVAGLLFGWPAGLIAGVLGSAYRFAWDFLPSGWGGGGSIVTVTYWACGSATLIAGLLSSFLRKFIFEDKRPNALSALGIGVAMEVLHMMLVLLTNLNDVEEAFRFVVICSDKMILANGLSVGISAFVAGFKLMSKAEIKEKIKSIGFDFGTRLLLAIFLSFAVTMIFVVLVVRNLNMDITTQIEDFQSLIIYITVFMEVLIFTALFVVINRTVRKKIVDNIHNVNNELNQITSGNLDTVIDVKSHKEFEELSSDVNSMVTALKGYISEAESRIDAELAFAYKIQHSSLPSVFPPYPSRKDFDIYASMKAAKNVGGDFYDFYLLDRFTLVFMIADVSGKGIPAAMFMMNAKTLIKGLSETGKPVDEVFNEANKTLCEQNDADMFITAWIGKLDFRTGHLTYCNAGHNPPVIYRKSGTFSYLKSKPDFILAGLDMSVYHMHDVYLNPGDSIFLYTDGITEAMNTDKELYGEDRLLTELNALGDAYPTEICETISKKVLDFAGEEPQSDDITMLSMKMVAMQDRDNIRLFPDQNSIDIVMNYLAERLSVLRIPSSVINKVQVASDEIYSNIVYYSKATYAVVSFKEVKGELMVRFVDNGSAFNPMESSTPDITLSADEREIGGLGIHMVKKMTSNMTYERNLMNENVLTIYFKIDD